MKHPEFVQEFLNTVGKNIRMHRKAKKMTLQQMSKEVGIHITGLSFIERGKSDCHILSLLRIADCLEVDVKELL